MKEKTANFILAVLVGLVVLGGVLFSGWLLGWFDRVETGMQVQQVRGIACLSRDGATFPVREGMWLRREDVLCCTPGTTAELEQGETRVILTENSELAVSQDGSLSLSAGLLLAQTDSQGIHLLLDGKAVNVSDGAVLCSDNALFVLRGTVGSAEAGESLTWQNGKAELGTFSLDAFPSSVQQLCEQWGISGPQLTEENLETSTDGVCYITVLCDSVLEQMEKLNPAKAEFIPADGRIVWQEPVPLTEGDTAFTVLQRLCHDRDIQLEFSWSPMYGSSYVEGISHLYEFDCGPQSGWMYRVNEEFPNYGASEFEVAPGDQVVWCYTVSGLGADLGGGS